MQALKQFLSRDFQGAPITDWLDLYAGALFVGFFGLLLMAVTGFFLLPGITVLVSLLTAFSCFCLGLWCSYFSDWAKDEPDHEKLRVTVIGVSTIFLILCTVLGVPDSWTSFGIATRDIIVWCVITVGLLVAQWPTEANS